MLLFLKEGDYSGGHAPNLQAAINVPMFATYITGDLLPEAADLKTEAFKIQQLSWRSSRLALLVAPIFQLVAIHSVSSLVTLTFGFSNSFSHRRLASLCRLRTGEGKMLARSNLAR